jgi:D-alanyl-D-alanine carboxypeptidase/D-alanyl-D-alanine-endopeptidase (penicillin-binding protein 4)
MGCTSARLPEDYRFRSEVISEIGISIGEVLDRDEFRKAFWGAQVVDLATGQVIYQRNADRYFVPASNAKLYTSASALDQLGPDYQFVTRLFAYGEISDSTLHGDLVVVGSGDPTIGGRFTDGDRTLLFRSWADSLRAKGIFRIEGNIIGDDNLFDEQVLGPGWFWDDEVFAYSAQIGSLTFNENCIDIEARATEIGQPAALTWEPHQTSYVEVDNRTRTIHPDSNLVEGYERSRASNRITVSSHVPRGTSDFESITIENPTAYFVHVLKESLERQGVNVAGIPLDIDQVDAEMMIPDGPAMLVAESRSVPLSDIAAVINKPSHNLYAELVLKTLGVERPANDTLLVAGSTAMGIRAVLRTLSAAGVDTSDTSIADGSGLSRYNLVSPSMMTSILTYMANHPDRTVANAFVESLPIAGEDGTLSNRLRDGFASGRVRAKTGTMTHVSTLSGYATLDDGTEIVFSLMCNNYTVPTSDVRKAQDEIVERLVSLAPRPFPE